MIKNVVFDIYNVLISEMDGPIHGTVDLLMELKSRNVPLYAITNLSEEGFEKALKHYPFLRIFDGVIVSGKVGLIKPDPAIFKHLLDTYDLQGGETLFIDDALSNVSGAKAAGLNAIQFIDPHQLENELFERRILKIEDYQSSQGCGEGCGCHH